MVDFRVFLEGDPDERKRAALELAGAYRNLWASPTWPATGSTRA